MSEIITSPVEDEWTYEDFERWIDGWETDQLEHIRSGGARSAFIKKNPIPRYIGEYLDERQKIRRELAAQDWVVKLAKLRNEGTSTRVWGLASLGRWHGERNDHLSN